MNIWYQFKKYAFFIIVIIPAHTMYSSHDEAKQLQTSKRPRVEQQQRCKCTWLMQLIQGIIAHNNNATSAAPKISEQELRRVVLEEDSTAIREALAQDPDPLFVIDLAQEYSSILKKNSGLQSIVRPKLDVLRKHVDNYLRNKADEVQKSNPTELHNFMLTHTLLPTVLITLIANYVGNTSTYTLPVKEMQYLGEKIKTKLPDATDPTLAMIPYCIDEKGQDLLHYVPAFSHQIFFLLNYGIDVFCGDNASTMWERCSSNGFTTHAIQNHIKRLQNDPIMFTSPIERELFFHVISKAVASSSHENSIGVSELRGISSMPIEQSREYKLVQDYITIKPELLAVHDAEGKSVFDYVNANSNGQQNLAIKSDAIVQLLLKHKANLNM